MFCLTFGTTLQSAERGFTPARSSICFFFNDTATTEIYTLSLHDALPISGTDRTHRTPGTGRPGGTSGTGDRKSTRLNSSHSSNSYAVFCLKKKHTTRSSERPQEKIRGSVTIRPQTQRQ